MSCLSYNCSPLDDYTPNDCGEELLSGFNQMMTLECDHTVTDFENASQLLANIASGKAKIFPAIRAGIDAPSPITVDPMVSGETANVVNYDRTAPFKDGNVNTANDNFYDQVFSGRKFGALIFYSNSDPDNPTITVINSTVKATGGKVAPDTDAEQQRYEGIWAWRSKKGPVIYDAPAGVFD